MTGIAIAIEDGTVQDLREQLHLQHHLKQQAEAKLTACQKALARGEELVTAAQGGLQRHDEAAELVAEAEARRIANVVAAGREATQPDDRAEDRAWARQTLESRLAYATRARSILQAEVEVAKRDLAAAARNVDSAIGAMAMEAGERLAAELIAAEEISLHIRMSLTALGGVWLPSETAGQPGRIRLGPQAVRALNDLPRNDDRRRRQGPAHIDPVAPFARDWRRTVDALREDPDAPLPGSE